MASSDQFHAAGTPTARQVAKEVRGPIEHMLGLVVSDFEGTGRPHRHDQFAEAAAGFFEFLVVDRGLGPASVRSISAPPRRFDVYLGRVGVGGLQELSPALLSAFVAERSAAGLAKTTVRDCCGVLRAFLRDVHREGVLGSDLSKTVEWPQMYLLSSIPRCSAPLTGGHRVAGGTTPSSFCW